jgi:uncharacterized protein (TIGR02284 family)
MTHEESEKVVSALNGLIETCKDGQKGYLWAVDRVHSDELKQLFRAYAAQRHEFATQLQEEVRHYGGDPEKDGTMVGALHRRWASLKTALFHHRDEHSVLAECAGSEESTLKDYEAVSHQVLPPDLQTLVSRQYAAIKAARERLLEYQHASTIPA